MAHPLASTYTSFIVDPVNRRLTHDDLGNFDLRGILDTGEIDGACRRIVNGQPGAALKGQATEVGPDPVAFYVEIRQDKGTFDLVYQGTAVFDAAGRLTSIAGRRAKEMHEGAGAKDAALGQNDGTWVATQP
jgi:hypothetical protein